MTNEKTSEELFRELVSGGSGINTTPHTPEDTVETVNIQPAPLSTGDGSVKFDEKTGTLQVMSSYEEGKIPSISSLPEERREMVKRVKDGIRMERPDEVIEFGSNLQAGLSDSADRIIGDLQNKDTGVIGDQIASLLINLDQIKPKDFSGLFAGKNSGNSFVGKFKGLISKGNNKVQGAVQKFNRIELQIEEIKGRLIESYHGLMDDTLSLEQMYERAEAYYDSLEIYIIAGNEKKKELVEELSLMKNTINEDGSIGGMEAQKLNDRMEDIARLDRRVNDLILSQTITSQTAISIRIIQGANKTLAERINSSILNTIPLWKTQIAVAMTLNQQSAAVQTQRLVNEANNNMLLHNAKMLNQTSIEIAKTNESQFIDVDTLKQTHSLLIDTIAQVGDIRADGQKKRDEVQKEILQLNSSLKDNIVNAINTGGRPDTKHLR